MSWRDDPLWVWWLNNTKMTYRTAISLLIIEEGERAAYASVWTADLKEPR
jgi:hypothetical protein